MAAAWQPMIYPVCLGESQEILVGCSLCVESIFGNPKSIQSLQSVLQVSEVDFITIAIKCDRAYEKGP